MKISYEDNPSPEDLQIITDGISSEAYKKRGLDRVESFCFFLRGEESKINGGIRGVIYYGSMYIDELWVDESCRGKGYGKDLILKAEELAKNKACNFISLNTMDFEARSFYEKLGYVVELERKGYFKSSIFYGLIKIL
jgi:ribosomal protein S18 acetylase RimI-like enzyme